MTSRSSFFKLMKEDLRQRLWTIVLASIVFLLPVPIYLAMQLSRYGDKMFMREFLFRLTAPLEAGSPWLALVTLCGALICAVSGFGYLFSKKKVDFFHALPVKKEKLFAVRYINGVLIYAVPYLLMLLISVIMIAFGAELSGEVMWRLVKDCIVHGLGFLTVYTVLILCVTFVGNIVVFFAVSGWTFGITAVAVSIFSWFESSFFETFCYYQQAYEQRLHDLRFLCPGYFYVSAVSEPEAGLLIQQLVYTVVLIGLALVVFKVRQSEGAGKAIAFPVLKPIIRVSVEILAGALIGMMFYEMTGGASGTLGWMLFGAVLGVVLSHMLIQSIFYFDVRKCFVGKASMVACIVVTAVFTLVMRYDVFGYDRYMPKRTQIESVAINMHGLDGIRSNQMVKGNHVYWTSDLETMELSAVDAAYPYLKVLVEDMDIYSEKIKNNRLESGYINVDVVYHLKNGKSVYRSYKSNGMREDLFAGVFETKEYKEGHYNDIYTVPSDWLTAITARYAMNMQEMRLSMTERREFMQVLRKELSEQTLREKLHTLPVAIVNLQYENTAGYELLDSGEEFGPLYFTNEIAIYPSFTETLRFLKERGFDPEKKYVWTGLESMHIEFPMEFYKYPEEAADLVPEAWVEEQYSRTEYIEWYPMTTSDKEWSYEQVLVAPENFERVYALCKWEELYQYGAPNYSSYGFYTVSLDVPSDGYNTQERYYFIIPKEADLSFLFDK